MQQTNLQKVNEYLPNRQAQYDFLIRRGYYMPSFKSSIVTIEFMHAVFIG